MERQERFMGSFAHELRTPMTAIIGYADLLRGQTLTPEEQRQAAAYIFSEGKRLENLSQKLLELLVLGRDEADLQPASPSDIIKGLVSYMGPYYGEFGMEIALDCQPGQCMLDAGLFRSLLVNLLDNARKAMEGRKGTVFIMCRMTKSGCRLSVSDRGRGIPEEALEHLTEAFYRADKSRARAQGGAGLGLSLCREIVRLHSGSLRFESQVGVGTTVTAVLNGGRP